MKVVAAIDLGGTFTKFGLVSGDGICLSQDRISTTAFKNEKEFCRELSLQLQTMRGDHRIVAAGIGAPNGNFKTGTINHAPNLPWKGIVPLARILEKELKVKCVLMNDANAGALGEMRFGSAKKIPDFIYITLGTGLGSGFVVNGRIVHGHHGCAGELGHVTIEKNGRACGCGKKGCLETYVSATGITRTAKEWMDSGARTFLNGTKNISASDLTLAARKGDRFSKKIFEHTGEILGMALANAVLHTGPGAIFISGGLAGAGELLFRPTIKHFEKNLFPSFRNKVKILPSRFSGNKAALLGAASLAWETV